MSDEEYAVLDAPERAVLRKGKPMKARLLKKWGGFYAGQVLTNVDKGSIPAGVAEFYEDDDPAVNTVVEQADVSDPLLVINDEINPQAAKAHDDHARAAAKASREVGDKSAAAEAVIEQERKDTQERARDADVFAAERTKRGASSLTAGQKTKLKAGKGHGAKAAGRKAKAK